MKTWPAHALFAILISSAAHAATTQVAVLPFDGPKSSVSRGQLVKAVCGELECVASSNAARGKKPDFEKAKRTGVDLILAGRITGPASKRVLTVIMWNSDGDQLSKDSWQLSRNGKFARGGLAEAKAKVLAVAGRMRPKSDPEGGPNAEIAEGPPLPSGPVLLPDSMPLDDRPDAGRKSGKPIAGRSRDGLPLVWVEAGVDITHRSFSYSELAVANLRAYVTQPALVAPKIQVAAYPLSRMDEAGVARALGIEAGFGFAVGLRSVDENQRAHPTSVTRLDLGARLDLRPVPGMALMLSPQLGYRNARFAVGAAEDGARLAGLPDLAYDALRVGVEAELPIESMLVFAKLNYLHALGLGEIGAEPYFPKSSAGGFDGALGAGYRVMENVEVRLSAHYTHYGLSFEAEPGATYVASGATDQYVGGALTGRFVY